MHLSLISFLDGHFNLRVKASDLKDVDSVDKLMTLIGKAKIK
jgi:acyl carrier protein